MEFFSKISSVSAIVELTNARFHVTYRVMWFTNHITLYDRQV